MPQIGHLEIFNQCILWSVKPNEQPVVFCVWQGLNSEIKKSSNKDDNNKCCMKVINYFFL